MLLEESSFTRLVLLFFLFFAFLGGDRDRDRDFDRGLFFLFLFRDLGRFLFLGDFDRFSLRFRDLERSRFRNAIGDLEDLFRDRKRVLEGDRDLDLEGDHDL